MVGRRGDGGADEELLVEVTGDRWAFRLTWLGRSQYDFGYGWKFGRNGGESDAGLDLHAGRRAHLWLRLRAPWLKWLRIEQGQPEWYVARNTGFSIRPHEGCYVRWEIDQTEGHHRSSDPWWREGSIGHRHVFGRQQHDSEVIDSGTPRVLLPEGHYDATAKLERSTWRHVRWPGTWLDRVRPIPARESWTVAVEGGVPVEGKGENSWDCGMDGVYSSSGLEGPTLGEACQQFVASVLNRRQRYGGPHDLPRPMTVSEAVEQRERQR